MHSICANVNENLCCQCNAVGNGTHRMERLTEISNAAIDFGTNTI